MGIKIPFITTKQIPAIILKKNATAPVQYAAEELIEVIEEITGIKLKISENYEDHSLPAILIGDSPVLTKILEQKKISLPLDVSSLGKEGSYLRFIPENNQLIILGITPLATLFGVYSLLTDYWGVRWYTPEFEIFPKCDELEIDEKLNKISKPSFNYRMTTFLDAQDPDWATRNRFNISFFAEDVHGGKLIDQGKMTHTFYSLISPKEHFTSHPEYFSLLPSNPEDFKIEDVFTPEEGVKMPPSDWKLERKASGGGGWGGVGQLCLTNPIVLDMVVKKVQQWRKEQPYVVGFGVAQNDSAADFCLCEKCMELNKERGSLSGSLVEFVNKVAERVNRNDPPTKIFTLAYTYSEIPPKIGPVHPQVVIALCHMRPSCDSHPLNICDKNSTYVKNLEGWLKLTENIVVWHYVVDFAHYMIPFPNLYALSKDVRWYYEKKIKGVLFQGNSSPSKGSEFQELKAWVLAQLSWNPKLDLWDLVKEFCEAYYRDAASIILNWLKLLNEEVENDTNKCMDLYSGIEVGFITRSTLDKGWKMIEDALKIVENVPEIYKRIEILKVGLYYSELSIYALENIDETGLSLKRNFDGKTMLDEFLKLCEKCQITQLAESSGFNTFIEKIQNKIS
jgi:uncharacterized protein DUF4838/glycosyl hydrolase family 67